MRQLIPVAVALAACPALAREECRAPRQRDLQVMSHLRRDNTAFTQGLVVSNSALLESSGAYGTPSMINRIDLRTGDVTRLRTTPENAYGEGLALLNERLYQLTWTEGKAFVYDHESLALVKTLPLPVKEGWGITAVGEELALSDGTGTLTFVDPDSFSVVRRLEVHDPRGEPYSRINELEWAEDAIYANLWHEDRIVEIDPHTGCVRSVIELGPLYEAFSSEERAALERDRESVPNGIAYHSRSRSFYLTGKNWPLVFRVKFSH
ncbi:MAG: glutaminyl-peptide cyclotransferase [Oligoflexia bacterium]|nr:glutaminyl-peptide cyclotransferase [Oligoflexia bacterium]